MLYVDAVTRGIDDMPTISDEVRTQVWEMLQAEGADGLLARLKLSDPEYYEIVDRKEYEACGTCIRDNIRVRPDVYVISQRER